MRVPLAALALVVVLASPEPQLDDWPAALERGSVGVLVSVRTLAIDGLDGLPVRENELLARTVDLAWDTELIPPGWTSPRRGLVARPVPLWRLCGPKREGVPVHGSAIRAVLAEIERALRERGISNKRAVLDPVAVRRLATPGGDGLLLISVISD